MGKKAMNQNDIYYITFAWDGNDELTEGEYTTRRYSMEDLLDCVDEYAEHWSDRELYIDSVSYEPENGEYQDFTKEVQDYLTTKGVLNGV